MAKEKRKGTIITIGADIMSRIPRCMENIYKIEAIPVTDNEDLEKDETIRMYSLRTILVEGTTVVDGGRAVNINGEFDISLESKRKGDDDDDDENELLDSVYYDRAKAIDIWHMLTATQLNKAEKEKKRLEDVINTLQISLDEKQY